MTPRSSILRRSSAHCAELRLHLQKLAHDLLCLHRTSSAQDGRGQNGDGDGDWDWEERDADGARRERTFTSTPHTAQFRVAT